MLILQKGFQYKLYYYIVVIYPSGDINISFLQLYFAMSTLFSFIGNALVKGLWLCLWELCHSVRTECHNSHKHSQSSFTSNAHENLIARNLIGFCFQKKSICCHHGLWKDSHMKLFIAMVTLIIIKMQIYMSQFV